MIDEAALVLVRDTSDPRRRGIEELMNQSEAR
jgi:hypothetical protein